ncbi:MAG: Glutamate racemase [Candidatus Ozemobacter sibiricus]|jgi:glutamate racemase|uniref:Glutamate racemase n=1 Tax=Candidatus Ozemobacter sibiricus TaxID=2268124 RepID=A0A367ZQK7_9BACT|nr:MAG: Glutamate racemase [Candidatus Ozemobacter sibiricus]
MNERPIGVFDSGVGGLTVVKEIRAALPHEDIIYFGDTARVPYGSKSVPVIRRFALEITRFLESQRVKMVVVACNTASALALDFLRRQTGLPVIGVIDPGVRAALRSPAVKRVGVIGTRATIRSEAYQKRLQRLRQDCRVIAKACPLLVPIVEENLVGSAIARQALEMYLDEFRAEPPDALILACTHYPLLKQAIRELLGPGLALIDSAEETAREVVEVLAARRIEGPRDRPGTEEFYVSDSPEVFRQVGEPFLGRPMGAVFEEHVWKRDLGLGPDGTPC